MKTKQWLAFALIGAALLPAPVSRGASPVTRVTAGFFDSLYLKADGSLWGVGWDLYGQLGDHTFSTSYPYGPSTPEQIVASNVTALAVGGGHSLFIKTNNSLWTMGWNAYGQLGDGTSNGGNFQTNLPEQIVTTNVMTVVAGLNHSVFLKKDGSLWVMGNNSFGQLGDGLTENGTYQTNAPEQLLTNGVTAVAAGYHHTFFLKSDGSLWGMGANMYGQLGDGAYANTNLPVQIEPGGVTAMAAGSQHSLFLKSDGSLWGMGNNDIGQLGLGACINTNLPTKIVASGVTAIAAGSAHSLFLKSDGSLWGMGNNHFGQLGNGTLNNTNQPVQIIASGVAGIGAGYGHSMFVKSDGSLWGMGDNLHGQLGTGNYISTNVPVQIVAPVP